MYFGVGGRKSPPLWCLVESPSTAVDVHGEFIVRWEIAAEFWPLLKHIITHGPCVDVIESLVEGCGDAVLSCCYVAEVAVSEFVRPEHVQAAVEEVPEDVGTVAVLGKNEALANARPGKKVDCVAVCHGLGGTGRWISMRWKVSKHVI